MLSAKRRLHSSLPTMDTEMWGLEYMSHDILKKDVGENRVETVPLAAYRRREDLF